MHVRLRQAKGAHAVKRYERVAHLVEPFGMFVQVLAGLQRLVQVCLDRAALKKVALHQPKQCGWPPLAVQHATVATAAAAVATTVIILAPAATAAVGVALSAAPTPATGAVARDAAARRALRTVPELLRELRGEGKSLNVGLLDRLSQVVYEHRANERGESKDAVIVHVGLASAFEALRVHEDPNCAVGVPSRPDPHSLCLRVALVADDEALRAADAHELVEQERLARAVGADD